MTSTYDTIARTPCGRELPWSDSYHEGEWIACPFCGTLHRVMSRRPFSLAGASLGTAATIRQSEEAIRGKAK